MLHLSATQLVFEPWMISVVRSPREHLFTAVNILVGGKLHEMYHTALYNGIFFCHHFVSDSSLILYFCSSRRVFWAETRVESSPFGLDRSRFESFTGSYSTDSIRFTKDCDSSRVTDSSHNTSGYYE